MIAVVGASGRLGGRVMAALAAHGLNAVAIGRPSSRLFRFAGCRIADLEVPSTLPRALVGAKIVVSCAHARFTKTLLDALPGTVTRVVLTGSTRKFTRFPDAAADQVACAEEDLALSGRPGVIVHPTMIYGADGENNVQRIAAYISRFGIVPLPDGGSSLVQPIHVDDVAACLVAAATRPNAPGGAIVVAGPVALSFASFVKEIAAAIEKPVRIISVPAKLLMAASHATRLVPGLPRITPDEVRRLLEHKAFPAIDMQRRLGVVPRPLELGLRETFWRREGCFNPILRLN